MTKLEQSKVSWWAPFVPLRKPNKGSFWELDKMGEK